MSSKALVTVDHLTTEIATPRGLVVPVDDVSFEIREGETLGVVGETGSGKTILVRSVMGLLPAGGRIRHQSRVEFDGVDLSKLSEPKLREYWGTQIALVPQDPATSLNPVRKIGDQIADSLRYHLGLSRRDGFIRAVELLDQVGIAGARSRLGLYPHELSGGMRQRVLIAIAISLKPRLLVADEPTTALDVTIQSQILDLIDALKVEIGMSVLFVSHDLSLVAGRSDRVAVMYGGRVIELLDSDALAKDSRHHYTAGLLQSRPDIDAPKGLDLYTIAGEPPDILNRPDGCLFAPRCSAASDICREEVPLLMADGEDGEHLVACHHSVTPEAAMTRGHLEDIRKFK